MHDEERTLTKRQSYWLKHVHAWQTSDKSIVEYSSDQDFTAQAILQQLEKRTYQA